MNLDPNALTDEQAEALFEAQKTYGISLSPGLIHNLQRAYVEWGTQLNKTESTIPIVSMFWCLAAAAATTVHTLSLQLRAHGMDDDAVAHWFEHVGRAADQLIREVRVGDDLIINYGTATDDSEQKAKADMAAELERCAARTKDTRATLDAITNAVASGNLTASGNA
jgi:hypothetical protein